MKTKLVFASPVTEVVSLTLPDMSAEDAFDRLLERYGLSKRVENGTTTLTRGTAPVQPVPDTAVVASVTAPDTAVVPTTATAPTVAPVASSDTAPASSARITRLYVLARLSADD